MFCQNCGSKVGDGTKFCSNCGASLLKNEEIESNEEKGKSLTPLSSVEPTNNNDESNNKLVEVVCPNCGSQQVSAYPNHGLGGFGIFLGFLLLLYARSGRNTSGILTLFAIAIIGYNFWCKIDDKEIEKRQDKNRLYFECAECKKQFSIPKPASDEVIVNKSNKNNDD